MTMTRLQLREVLDGIVTQLDSHETKDLFYQVLEKLTTKQKKEILQHCQKIYPTDTRISLEENGIVETV